MIIHVFGASGSGDEPKKLLLIDSQDGEPYASARTAMIQTLRLSGFSEGRNLIIKRYSARGFEGRAKRILMTEADRGYDVIFINGTTAAIAAFKFGYKNFRYKFVFCSVTDPVGVGVIRKLNVPTNSNFTGIAYPVSVVGRLRFLKEVLPHARTVGMIYADMFQSQSYVKWLDAALKRGEFRNLKIIYRKVEHVKSNMGYRRMSMLAEKHVRELDPQVDAFLSPCDQLGTKREFAEMVSRTSRKPLMGLTENDIRQDWGAHFAFYMNQHKSGKRAAGMIVRLFRGERIRNIIPESPQGEYGINMKRSKKIGLEYPHSAIRKAGRNIVW